MNINDYTREEKDQALDEAWEIMNGKDESDSERLERLENFSTYEHLRGKFLVSEGDYLWLMEQTQRTVAYKAAMETHQWNWQKCIEGKRVSMIGRLEDSE